MSTTAVVVGAIAALVVLVAVMAVSRRRSPQSSVDSFRRQIDALGPAARRTVVDQVQQTAANREPDVREAGGDAAAADAGSADADQSDGERSDEDGPRGA